MNHDSLYLLLSNLWKEKIYIFEKKRRQQLLFLHCSIIDANSDMN